MDCEHIKSVVKKVKTIVFKLINLFYTYYTY